MRSKTLHTFLRPPGRPALAAILLIFIIAGFIYSLSTPFLDVSDEVRHYAMVEHLAQGNGLPVQDPAHHGFYEQEGSQPPLYYALMALVVQPFDRSDFLQLAQFNPHARLGRADATNNLNQLIHTDAEQFPWRGTALVAQLIRWLGVLMGAVTVACTYGLARELTDDEGLQTKDEGRSIAISLLAAALTAFNPMFVFISASVNNDNLAAMLSALALWLGARAVRRGLTWRRAGVLGLVLGGAALSKVSALALVAVIPAAILLVEILRQRKETATWRSALAQAPRLLVSLSPLLLVPLALAGWWYARNQVLYGDFTGTTMMATIAGTRETLPSASELIGEWDGFRKAYWGLFGAVNIPMDLWIYTALDALLVLGGVGLVLVARDCVADLRSKLHDPNAGPALWAQVVAALMCLGVFVVAFAALVRWTSITFASQGRLLFPVIAVISTFVAWGVVRLAATIPGHPSLRHASRQGAPSVDRRTRPVAVRFSLYVLPAALALLTLAGPFLDIQPAYATPARLRNEAQLPADLVKTELRFADAIRWIGYRVETERVQPGGEFVVTLYWQGLRAMDTNYSAFIRLLGRDSTQIVLLDTYPGGGMWQTTRWTPGEIVADRYRLRIDPSVTNTALMPTVLQLDVGFWDFSTKQFLPTFDGAGQPTGRQRYEAAGMAVVQPDAPSNAGPHLAQATIAGVDAVQRDGKLDVTIHWESTADFDADYTIFRQLFDASGQKVAQADGRAMEDGFSTRWWRKGDRIPDRRTLDLPANLPAGDYVLKYGLYRQADGARMPAFDAQGQPIPDAALTQTITLH